MEYESSDTDNIDISLPITQCNETAAILKTQFDSQGHYIPTPIPSKLIDDLYLKHHSDNKNNPVNYDNSNGTINYTSILSKLAHNNDSHNKMPANLNLSKPTTKSDFNNKPRKDLSKPNGALHLKQNQLQFDKTINNNHNPIPERQVKSEDQVKIINILDKGVAHKLTEKSSKTPYKPLSLFIFNQSIQKLTDLIIDNTDMLVLSLNHINDKINSNYNSSDVCSLMLAMFTYKAGDTIKQLTDTQKITIWSRYKDDHNLLLYKLKRYNLCDKMTLNQELLKYTCPKCEWTVLPTSQKITTIIKNYKENVAKKKDKKNN